MNLWHGTTPSAASYRASYYIARGRKMLCRYIGRFCIGPRYLWNHIISVLYKERDVHSMKKESQTSYIDPRCPWPIYHIVTVWYRERDMHSIKIWSQTLDIDYRFLRHHIVSVLYVWRDVHNMKNLSQTLDIGLCFLWHHIVSILFK